MCGQAIVGITMTCNTCKQAATSCSAPLTGLRLFAIFETRGGGQLPPPATTISPRFTPFRRLHRIWERAVSPLALKKDLALINTRSKKDLDLKNQKICLIFLPFRVALSLTIHHQVYSSSSGSIVLSLTPVCISSILIVFFAAFSYVRLIVKLFIAV